MKKLTRTISALLALAMLLGLAACGKQTPSSTSGAEGEKIMNIGIQLRPTVESLTDNHLKYYLEEQTGYKIDYTMFISGASEWRSQFSTMVASGEELPDIMFGFGWNEAERYTYGADGYLVDMAPFFEDEELTADYRARLAELYGEDYYDYMLKYLRSPDGGIYAFPTVNFTSISGPRFASYINKTWLDNLGLEMPTTYEEFVAVLRAFQTQDPNGNGKQDEIPALGMVGSASTTTATTTYDLPSWILNNWLYVDDTKFFNSEDGKLWVPYITDEYRTGVQALHDLLKEGLLSTMTWTLSQSTREIDAILGPSDGVSIVGVYTGDFNYRMPQDNPCMYDYVPLPPFNYAPLAPQIPNAYLFITQDCEVPEDAFKLFLAMTTEEGAMRSRYGVEGMNWEWAEDDSPAGKGVKWLDNYTAKSSHNVNYGNNYGIVLRESPDTPYHIIPDPEAKWLNDKTATVQQHADTYKQVAAANNPAEVVDKLIYTTEESDALGNINTEILIYVKESRAKFAIGDMDPYSDADWQKYVDTLYDMGLQTWLDIAQDAWDRLNAQ